MGGPDEPTGGPADGRSLRWAEHNLARRGVIVAAAIAVLEGQAPGEELQVQAVAERAGLSRTVIYRHFADRADLDRAVQQRICEDIAARLLPALVPQGKPQDIVLRLTDAFVSWAALNPALYWFVDRDPVEWGTSPLRQAIEQLAGSVESLMTVVLDAIGFRLDPRDWSALDPWIFGLIGTVFATVRRWLEREVRDPSAQALSGVLAASVWCQVDGMARSRGLHLDELPVAEALASLAHPEPAAADLAGLVDLAEAADRVATRPHLRAATATTVTATSRTTTATMTTTTQEDA